MIVLDIEATGTDPRKHALLSIGALELENPENEFYGECGVWEGAKIEEEALAINGFTRAEITDPSKQSLDILMTSFLKWSRGVNNQMIVGHNVSLDWYFLRFSTERVGENWTLSKRVLDTHSLAFFHMVKRGEDPPFDTKHKHSDINLGTIIRYVGIESERGTHNALEDAKLTAEATSRLLYDKKLLSAYEEYEIPWVTKDN